MLAKALEFGAISAEAPAPKFLAESSGEVALQTSGQVSVSQLQPAATASTAFASTAARM